jgi:hypothetical protein
MRANMMIPDRKHPSLPATGINPASFPLGSMESRAAIRALLLGRSALSDDDLDALILYAGAVYLDARMKPNYRELEATAAYQRGAELYRLRRGPTLLAHVDQHLQRSTFASLEFEAVHGREPKAGDRLSYEDMARDQNAQFLAAFINAWGRKLPTLVCPLKLQDGELYFRTLGDDSSEVWQQKTDAGPQTRWRAVQRDAMGDEPGAPEVIPTVPIIRFLGVVNGKHRCQLDAKQSQLLDPRGTEPPVAANGSAVP